MLALEDIKASFETLYQVTRPPQKSSFAPASWPQWIKLLDQARVYGWQVQGVVDDLLQGKVKVTSENFVPRCLAYGKSKQTNPAQTSYKPRHEEIAEEERQTGILWCKLLTQEQIEAIRRYCEVKLKPLYTKAELFEQFKKTHGILTTAQWGGYKRGLPVAKQKFDAQRFTQEAEPWMREVDNHSECNPRVLPVQSLLHPTMFDIKSEEISDYYDDLY